LPLRVPGPLRHGVPEGTPRARRLDDGVPAGRARRLPASLRRAARAHGLEPPRHAELVQERARPRDDDVALAPGRLLGLDQGAGARRLRAALGRATPGAPSPRTPPEPGSAPC